MRERRCFGCYDSFSGPWCDNCDQWPCTCIVTTPPDSAMSTTCSVTRITLVQVNGEGNSTSSPCPDPAVAWYERHVTYAGTIDETREDYWITDLALCTTHNSSKFRETVVRQGYREVTA